MDELYFDPKAALARLEETGDLFADVLKLKQAVPEDVAAAIKAENKREGGTVKQLHEYSRKRDFSATAEPAASVHCRQTAAQSARHGYHGGA